LHGVEVLLVVNARLIESNDVGMFELAQGLDFALKAVLKTGVLGQLRGKNLDRRLFGMKRRVGRRRVVPVRQVDASHAAAAQFIVDDPLAQTGADHVNQLSGWRNEFPYNVDSPFVDAEHENSLALD